jgi:hypothetical protein
MFTEEEVRSNIVIPFLRDVGLTYNDLKLETSFSIQLGRGVYNINNEERKSIKGRLDILCRVDSKNLFVIELKAEGVRINKEKDSRQGLSYARLLQPMPPYVIVTNAIETYVYDTIHGVEVNKDFIIKNGYSLSLDDDINFRFNALKNFIGYSYNNLLVFCKTISREYVDKFCASDKSSLNDKKSKKYVPSLFVEREGLVDDFKLFLTQQDKNVFAITGASGCGKTNAILNLYNNQSDIPSLFYSGTLLGESFFDEIKFDFNLEFSPQETELAILKKISSLSEQHKKRFIFFIDAIDEWIAHDKLKQLDRIIKVFSQYNIKLCISCKDLLWPALLMHKGIATNLSEQLHSQFNLGDFNDDELNEAYTNYSNVFNVPVNKRTIVSKLNNPFSLRIAFEVANSNNKALLNSNSLESIALYLKHKLQKTTDQELCKRYLYSISEVLLKNNTIHEDERNIRNHLQLNLNDSIPEDLFLNGLLYRYNIDNRSYIGFYFSKIRDYIISTEILFLKGINPKEINEKIIHYLDSFIGQNAVNFRLGNCNNKELVNCIDTLMYYDKNSNEGLTLNLFVQQDDEFFSRIQNEEIEKLKLYIKDLIKNSSSSYSSSEEIHNVLSKISKVVIIESYLIGLLHFIHEYSLNYHVYHICKLLEKYNTTKGKDELVELVLNKNVATELRRFILDTLCFRNLNNRKQILVSMMEELVTFNSGPLAYITNWYSLVEDPELRDAVLSYFDKQPRISFSRMLSSSKLMDTGPLLYERFTTNEYSEESTWWLCRAICTLNFKPAIPRFIKIIKAQPESKLAGHLLIGLGEMKAQELKPLLLHMIESLTENHKNEIWFDIAFDGIMEDSDYIQLLELAIKSTNTPTIFFAAKTLSNKKGPLFNEFILSCLRNKKLDENQLVRVFQTWANNLVVSGKDGDIKIIKLIENPCKILNDKELNEVYSIFGEKTELSNIAFSILLNFENNIDRLYDKFISVFPEIKFPFATRRTELVNLGNMKKLNVKLGGWLKHQLLLSSWENEVFIFNCLQLVAIFGDNEFIEVIEANKINLFDGLPFFLDGKELDKEIHLDGIIRTIRISNHSITPMLSY